MKRRGNLAARWSLAPYSIWALLFILVPLVFVAYYAFTDTDMHFTLDNIRKFFTATSTVTGDNGETLQIRTYMVIFWRSVKLAVISTIVCLLMGYPIAYIIARATPKVQKIVIQ